MAVVAPAHPRPAHHTIHPAHMPSTELDKLAASLKAGAGGKKLPSLDALSGAKAPSVKELLANPVVFVSPKGRVEEEDIPYKAVNAKTAPSKPNGVSPSSLSGSPIASTSKLPAAPSSSSSSSSSAASAARTFPLIDPSVSWSKPYGVGAGLNNLGNTCFLNSALQCLVHTPPLVRYLENGHPSTANCNMWQKKNFCMTCVMKLLVKNSFGGGKKSYSPNLVTKNIKSIAKHFRIGRQEDAHEFLRFCIDAMQASSLFGKGKLPPAQQHQSPLHQIFGGRLRSRVHCESCGHNSDTYDHMLDLSLDINGRTDTLRDALGNLVKVDRLTGGNKYKCEKCNKLVNATKSFTIEDAPLVLTIHLKRFTPMGRKISNVVKYPEQLKLGPYMSNPSLDPTYRLSSLILHSGGGPHSGHYTSYVRSGPGSNARWFDMNDDYVSSVPGGGPPLGERNAYVLFYVREKGDALKGAINGGVGAAAAGIANGAGGGAGGKKRQRDSPAGTPVKRVKPDSQSMPASSSPPVTGIRVPFIGPGPPEILTASKAASPRLSKNDGDCKPPASPPKAPNPFVLPSASAASSSSAGAVDTPTAAVTAATSLLSQPVAAKQFVSRTASLTSAGEPSSSGSLLAGADGDGLGKKKKSKKNGKMGVVNSLGKKGERRASSSSSSPGGEGAAAAGGGAGGMSKAQMKKAQKRAKWQMMGIAPKNMPGVLR
ncbi:hypothetical protein JCM6882_002349 [Rhodosporidiobolus microsporus]